MDITWDLTAPTAAAACLYTSLPSVLFSVKSMFYLVGIRWLIWTLKSNAIALRRSLVAFSICIVKICPITLAVLSRYSPIHLLFSSADRLTMNTSDSVQQAARGICQNTGSTTFNSWCDVLTINSSVFFLLVQGRLVFTCPINYSRNGQCVS